MNIGGSSLFSQILSLVDRDVFRHLVTKTGSEARTKGFSSWDHFVSMLFCQMAQAKSLREINAGLRSCEGKLRHLGMEEAPGRSTLSYANANRPPELFEMLFHELFDYVSRSAPKKKNAEFFKFEDRPVKAGSNVISDCTGQFNVFDAGRKIKGTYRKVVVWIEEKQEAMELLTNRFDLAAGTIAEIYKQRWQIELFFKAIKQNLRLKTFVGTSANAVKAQIWTALIAMLLIKFLQFESRMKWALSNLVALLRWNLFTHKNLWKWVDDPFIRPNPPPEDELVQPFLDGILQF